MNSILNKPIVEVIKDRHSVRSYSDKEIPSNTLNEIEEYINKLDNPFNIDIKIKLIKTEELNGEVKLGTYRVVKGGKYFFTVSCKEEKFALQALGYTFESLVLYCTSLGLGTVWLGGSFTKGRFAKLIGLSENEILPIVSPLGYEGDKHSLLAKLFNKNSNKRKSFSEGFFNGNFDTELTKEAAKEYEEVLEMVRLAPSAVNKQPWRILKREKEYCFFIDKDNSYTNIDIGIAMCHFHLTAIEKGLKGNFEVKDPKINTKLKYVISWNVLS